MTTPLAAFGPGILIVTRTDISNTVSGNVVPAVNVGYAQELHLDFAAAQKDLFGQNQFPLLSTRGTIKATGKIKAAVLSGIAWNNTFFGQTFTSGGYSWVINESATPAAGAYTAAHTAGFVDLGVTYQSSGLPLQRMGTGSTLPAGGGFYTVTNAGVYAVATPTDNVPLFFTYTYTPASPVGQSMIVTNQPLGFTPTFQLDYYTNVNQPAAKPFAVRLFSCIGSKLALATKLEDFVMPEIDFGFFANSAGQVIDFVYPEVS